MFLSEETIFLISEISFFFLEKHVICWQNLKALENFAKNAPEIALDISA